jgi:polysaccharide chain length determinant protein (PEP-CTERM system associated)
MAEVYQAEETGKLDFGRYLDVARRRHMYFLIPLLLGWMVVCGISWVLSPRYKSTTQILVSEPAMSKNYVTPNVDDDLQARLQSMQQQILSRTRLLLIIDSMHLYQGGRKPMTDDDKVVQMRKEINIDLVRDAQTARVTGFKIDYSAQNPRVAQLVTGQLADLFISENNRNLIAESGNTTRFLEDELAKAAADLAAMDAKKKAFEATHVGTLPNQETSNLQILTGLQGQLTNEQDALNNATTQRAMHQTLIQQLRTNPTATPRAAIVDPNSVEAIDIQLGKLRDQLTDLRSRYTDSYPDVIKLRAQIAQTQKQRDVAVAEEKARADKVAGPDSLTLAQLEAQLKSDEVEIENRKASIAGLQARIAEYESRINAEPASEQQLADIQRGYEQSQANYNDLLKKKQDSQMATNMEENLQGERFTMLDAPSLPIKPDFPNRLEFCLAGLLAGLALGSFSVIGFEFADDRLHNEGDIKDILPVPVICEIPEVSNPSDEQNNRRKVLIGWAAAAAVMVIILVGSAVSYLHG